MSEKRTKKALPPLTTEPDILAENQDLRLFWIAFHQNLEADILDLLEDFDIDDYVRWDEETRTPQTEQGLIPEIWPDMHELVSFTVPADMESSLVEEVHRLRRHHPGEPVEMIVHPYPGLH